MTDPGDPTTGGRARPVERARAAYRRVRSAAGVTELPALEQRVDELAGEVAESRALEVPLAAALARVETSLVPLLEAHEARRARRAAGERPDVP